MRLDVPHPMASVATYNESGRAFILHLLSYSVIGTASAVGDQ